MLICFYNKFESKIDFTNEVLSFHPNVLIAEGVMADSMGANHMISYLIADDFSDEQIFLISESYYRRYPALIEKIDDLPGLLKDLKKSSKVKHKSKEQLVSLGKIRNIAKASRIFIKEMDKAKLLQYNLFELIQFAKDEIMQLCVLNYFEEKGNENLYIKGVIEDIDSSDHLFCLDQGIENLFSYQLLESQNDSPVLRTFKKNQKKPSESPVNTTKLF